MAQIALIVAGFEEKVELSWKVLYQDKYFRHFLLRFNSNSFDYYRKEINIPDAYHFLCQMEAGYDSNSAWICQNSVTVCKTLKDLQPTGAIRMIDICFFLKNSILGYPLASYINVTI